MTQRKLINAGGNAQENVGETRGVFPRQSRMFLNVKEIYSFEPAGTISTRVS
jgi:hypothetical protein